MEISFLGGAREVGRSCFLVDSGQERILLDEGVKLSEKETDYPLEVKSHIDAAIISHAHLDHSGNLPHLFLHSRNMCYMTPPTLELAKILWFDTLKIAGLEGMNANFSKEEIARTERFAFESNYNRKIQITENCSMEFFDAGHILGSAIVKLGFGKKSLVYTGDFKEQETRLHHKANLKLGKVDYLLIESTYGDRDHPDRKETEKQFVEEVQDTIDRGGWAVVPAFAVGRSQEIIDILHEYKLNADIYFDGMGQKVSKVFLRYPKFLKNPGFLKKALNAVKWISRYSMRKKALKQPGVVVTTAGMLQGGPVYSYLPELYKDKNSSLLLTGFQVPNTPGAALLETGKINLNGINVDVKMNVKKFDFSAHAGRTELFSTVNRLNPEKVFCIHGDEKIALKFARDLKKEGFDAVAPEFGETIKL